MKTDIHPDYTETSVRCSCGNTFTTRSTKPEITLELCNECHPFFTGKQKLVDSGGRVERFQRRYAARAARRSRPLPPRTEPPAGRRPTGRHRRPRAARARRAATPVTLPFTPCSTTV